MPNVKFSGFNAITSVGANGFLVGYDSVTNLNTRITLANLKTSLGVMNPTSGYVPFNNGGSFSDSLLRMIVNGMETYTTTGSASGLTYDAATAKVGVFFNDFLYIDNSTYIEFDSSNNIKSVSCQGLYTGGFHLKPPNTQNSIYNYKFGSIDSGPYTSSSPLLYFNIDYNGTNTISCFFNDGFGTSGEDGFDLDFTNNEYLFGSLITGSELYIDINYNSGIIRTDYLTNNKGFYLDFVGSVFQFGDPVTNSNYIEIQSGLTQSVTISSNNPIVFNDNGTGNMISVAPTVSPTGDYLVLNINGGTYYLPLYT